MSDAATQPEQALSTLGPLLDRLEQLLSEAQDYDQPARDGVFEILDGVDTLHRLAITRLAAAIGPDLDRLVRDDPSIHWLFEAYGVSADVAAVLQALDPMQPYLTEHGGAVEVLAVANGVVRLRMVGACSGCTAAAVTLREGVEAALREGLPGFVGIEVEPDQGVAHPPPGPTLLQIQPRPA